LEEKEPVVSYQDEDLLFSKTQPSRTQRRRSKKRNSRSDDSRGAKERNLDGSELESLVRFDDTPPITSVDSEEQGGDKAESQSDHCSPVEVETSDGDELYEDSESKTTNSTINSKRAREEVDNSALQSFDPLNNDAEVEMTSEINDYLDTNESAASGVGGAHVTKIVGHNWMDGRLKLKVTWATEQTTWEELRDMKEDHPKMTAEYIVSTGGVSRSTTRGDRTLDWAKKTLRDLQRAVRRVARLYDFHLDKNNDVYLVRRVQKRKKKKIYSIKPILKYGVRVPRSVRDAIELDKSNGNSLWQDAIKLEITSLIDLECFEFKPSDFSPGNEFQKTTLMTVFDVKQDLRRKARLVAGGHLVDALDHDIYSSTVKGISVKLLHVIAHKANLKQLCGDVANAYVNAYTNEKVYAKAGPEFGSDLVGSIVIIQKALYGLRSSSERWHAHFADTLRALQFKQSRYDKDVWIRLGNESLFYEYVCTHVDDFMIVSKTPEKIMESIKATYSVKSVGPPDYYLGNDYKKDRQGRWCIGCKKYLVEAIKRVENIFGSLKKYSCPSETGDHPELDSTPLLSDDEHRKYQMLIGILVWVVTIGRIDVAHATSSLSRFTACPRKGHLERLLRVFGYLKKRPNRRIVVDSRDPIYEGGEDSLSRDFTKELGDQYPGAFEEIDANLPKPLIDEIEITVFVDSDHAHDKVSRRSITGLLIFVGRTPVFYTSKRQGAIETSTYGAEFCGMKTAVEELIAVRYMLRCLGVKVEHASMICGDNLGVIQNATIAESLLKKKHVAIAYHKTREAAAAGICHPIKTGGVDNFADTLTKAQTIKTFCTLVGGFMFG
jgi:hypothetical protein